MPKMNVIEFDVFKQMIKDEILEQLEESNGPKYEVEEVHVTKANDQELSGLAFTLPDHEAAPTIYLNDAYQRYLDGEGMEKLAGEFVEMIRNGERTRSDVPQIEFDHATVRDHLTLRLLGLDHNRQFLSECPYRIEANGLALVYELAFKDGGRGTWRTRVTTELMEEAGYTEEELYEDAMKNAPMQDHPIMFRMDRYFATGGMRRNVLGRKSPFRGEDKSTVYVLSNESGMLGAAVLSFPGMMKKISDLFKEGFYVIPSSIHEVLIVPENAGTEPSHLREMLHKANRTVVDAGTILADEIYYYDRQDERLLEYREVDQTVS